MSHQRLLIVYSPHSSHHARIKREVIDPARQLPGFMLGKYQVRQASVEDNAAALAMLLRDDDLVISAGGDGTATMTINAIMESKKRVTLGILGYGNFNDLSHTLRIRNLDELINTFHTTRPIDFYPLECLVNGQHYRYAACYFTVGLLAQSVTVFDRHQTRRQLESGRRGLFYSIKSLAGWYFRHRHQSFIPQNELNGELQSPQITDFIALNTPYMARIMHGASCHQQGKTYLSTTANLSTLPRLCLFMAKSILSHVTRNYSSRDIIKFTQPATLDIQAEGEHNQLTDITSLTFRKSSTPLHILTK